MATAREDAIAELLRRGAIDPNEARALLSQNMTHAPAPKVPGVAAAIREYLPDSLESIKNAAGAAATGAGKFLGGVLDLPANFLQGLEDVTAGGPFGDPGQKGAQYAVPTDALRKVFPQASKAIEDQSVGQKAIAAGVEGGLAFANPSKWVSLPGAVLTSIAEVVKQQADSPAAKRIAVVLGLSPIALQMRTPRDIKAVRSALDELGPEELQKLKAFSDEATARLGTHVSPLTAVPPNTEMATVFERLVKSPQGAGMRQQLAAEQNAGGAKVQDLVGQLTGEATDQSGANRVAQALLGAEKEPFAQMQGVAGPLYRKAASDTMPYGSTDFIAEAVRRAAKGLNAGPTSKAGKAAESSARAVEKATTESTILAPNGQPFTYQPKVLELDTLKKEAADAAAAGAEPGAKPGLKSKRNVNLATESELRDATGIASPSLNIGRMLYTTGHDWLVDPMKKGPTQTLITKEMRDAGRGDWGVFGQLFDATKLGAADIRDVATRVTRQDPEAFPLMFKQNLEAKLDNATAGNFAEAIIGRKGELAGKREENFREAVKQVQLARGTTPQAADAAAEGATRLMSVVRDLESGKARLDGKALSEMNDKAGGNKLSDLLRMINPFTGTLRTWAEAGPLERRLLRKVYTKLAKTLSEPGGAQALIEMSQYDAKAQATQLVGRALIGTEIVND